MLLNYLHFFFFSVILVFDSQLQEEIKSEDILLKTYGQASTYLAKIFLLSQIAGQE